MSNNPEIVSSDNEYNPSLPPLHQACCDGDLEAVKQLIEEDPEDVNMSDDFFDCPFCYASGCKYISK